MQEKPKYVCIHEEQLQGQSRKIAELETRADYKEKSIMEIKDDIKEIKKSMESLESTINNFILKSINDDSSLREVINQQGNRITSLETTNRTLKWVVGIGFSASAVFITAMAFILSHIH